MQPIQDALIESKVPPGYERLAPGTIIKEDDLAWYDHSCKFEAPRRLVAMDGVSPRKVTVHNYIIRKTNQKQTVSQDQAPKPNYGLW